MVHGIYVAVQTITVTYATFKKYTEILGYSGGCTGKRDISSFLK